MMTAERARRIETVDDVHSVLASSRWSFVELLEAIEVCKASGDWELVDRLGTEALAMSGPGARADIPKLVDAARAVVAAHLSDARDLEGVSDALDAAHQSLTGLKTNLETRPGRPKAIGEVLRWIDGMRLLLMDDDAISRVKLSGELRHVQRPDLAIDAATRALAVEPNNTAALTTRAAAYADRKLLAAAFDDIDRAWRHQPSAHAASAYCRILSLRGMHEDAVALGEQAFLRWPEETLAVALLSSAAKAEDQDVINRTRRFLAESNTSSDVSDSPDPWITLLAVDALIIADRLDEASALLRAATEKGSPHEKKVRQLKGKLKRALNTRQGRLELR